MQQVLALSWLLLTLLPNMLNADILPENAGNFGFAEDQVEEATRNIPVGREHEIPDSIFVDSVCQFHVVKRKFDYLAPYRPAPFEQALGSGFFISPDGEILTNSHVVKDAVALWITLPGCGKTKIPVEIIGQCPERDIALVKLTEEGFQLICQIMNVDEMAYLPFGDSDTVSRLDKVYAIGYPLGQKRLKATKGVISGPEYIHRESYIQMDAAINPGSSGGPLLNRNAEVVGLTTAGFLAAQNVGYIVPINHVKFILEGLHENSIVHLPYLGVHCNPGSEELAQYLGNPTPSGLYIFYVQPDTIADRAGLQAGDMLYRLQGCEIDEHGDTRVSWSAEKVPLNEITSRLKVGEKVSFEVYRSGQHYELATECTMPLQYPNNMQFGPVDYEVVGGMAVMQLCENHFDLIQINPYMLDYLRPEKNTEPVLVITSLLPGTEITKVSRLVPGLLIAEVNEVPVKTLAEFRQALLKSVETGLVVLKTHGDLIFVYSLEKILKDQRELIRDRICPPTELTLKLFDQMGSPLPQ